MSDGDDDMAEETRRASAVRHRAISQRGEIAALAERVEQLELRRRLDALVAAN